MGDVENTSDIAPNPKRRKLDHVQVSRQDEARRSSDHETGRNGGHSLERPNPSIQKRSSASTSRAGESKSTALYAGEMYKSSIFKLQVDEMLRVVQPNYAKLMEPLEKALRKLKILIEGIEEREPITVGLFLVTGIGLCTDALT